MSEQASQELTSILRRWTEGDAAAGSILFEQLYGNLRALARARLAGERSNHTLQPTALVHEAWLKLSEGSAVDWHDRVHFFAVAARAMRQILVDSGRRHNAQKRDGRLLATVGTPGAGAIDEVDVLDLDEALARLEALQPEQARIVELRYFGGLSIEEAAAVMDVSVSTVNRSWRASRAWLYLQLKPEQQE